MQREHDLADAINFPNFPTVVEFSNTFTLKYNHPLLPWIWGKSCKISISQTRILVKRHDRLMIISLHFPQDVAQCNGFFERKIRLNGFLKCAHGQRKGESRLPAPVQCRSIQNDQPKFGNDTNSFLDIWSYIESRETPIFSYRNAGAVSYTHLTLPTKA